MRKTRKHADRAATSISRRALLTSAVPLAAPSALSVAPRGAVANIPATTPKRGYATGPYGLVHYYDNAAPGGAPLLMFHQAPMSARQFDNVYAPLAKRGIRAIGIDMPGFGLSDVTSFVPKVEDWAKVAPAVLQHLGLRQSNVLGHHTGAMVATEVGVQFPKMTRSLVVNGPMPIEDDERVKLLEGNQKGEVDFVYQPDGSHLAAAFMTRWKMYGGADGAGTGFKADPRLITRYTVERFQGFGPFWYGHHAAFKYDHEKGLRALRVRTLLLTNTTDMIYEHCQAARRIRPDFDYAEIQGGGVDIVDQEPELWSEIVAKFVHEGDSKR